MNKLVETELFALLLATGSYVLAVALYKKTKIGILHPLITSIALIITVLKLLEVDYPTFREGTRFIHFLLGPSVVALGYVLYQQMQYIKGNVVSILTAIFVGSVVGILSVAFIGTWMGADATLIATLQPKSVTTPIAMDISRNTGGIPPLTAIVVVLVGLFGSVVGPFVLKALGIESRIAKGLALGASSHGIGTSVALQIGAIEGALSGLAIGLMGVITAIMIPIVKYIMELF